MEPGWNQGGLSGGGAAGRRSGGRGRGPACWVNLKTMHSPVSSTAVVYVVSVVYVVYGGVQRGGGRRPGPALAALRVSPRCNRKRMPGGGTDPHAGRAWLWRPHLGPAAGAC